MNGDGSPWRSGSAEFDDVGFSLVKRDIEVLMLAVQGLRGAGLTESQIRIIIADVIAGRLPWGITEGGTGATDAATARSNLGLGALAVLASPLPIANGGTGQTTQQLALDAVAGGVTANRVLRGDGTHVALGQVAKADIVNSSASSVLGRSAASSGVLADIAAGGAGQILKTDASSVVSWLAAGADGYHLTMNAGILKWLANYFLGTTTAYTTPNTYTDTVPIGKYQMWFVAIGAGGGASWNSGNVTMATLVYYTDGAGGGSGAIAYGTLACAPGDTVTSIVGAGGTAGTSGTPSAGNGGDTSISVGASTITVDGGYGAAISTYMATPGDGGIATNTGSRLDIIALPGRAGTVGTLSIGGNYFMSNVAIGGQAWLNSKGGGGAKARGGTPSAGGNGYVIFGFMA